MNKDLLDLLDLLIGGGLLAWFCLCMWWLHDTQLRQKEAAAVEQARYQRFLEVLLAIVWLDWLLRSWGL